MTNRRFEMFQDRQVIHRMRMGQSDGTIANAKLVGRLKRTQVGANAEKNDSPGAGRLPSRITLV